MKSFEFKDPHSGAVLYLEILETFVHYYTKKKIYRCRIHDRSGTSNDWSFDETEFAEILANRIKKPIGYVKFKDGSIAEITSTGFSPCAVLEFSTSLARYRFRVIVEDYEFGLKCLYDLKPVYIPTFEMYNPANGDWFAVSSIDHIELIDQKEVMENDQA